MKLETMRRDLILGYRPCRGKLLAMIVACERAGVTEITEITRGSMKLVTNGQATPEQVVDARERGLVWCTWHGRFEPRSAFTEAALDYQHSRDCREGNKARSRLRRDR